MYLYVDTRRIVEHLSQIFVQGLLKFNRLKYALIQLGYDQKAKNMHLFNWDTVNLLSRHVRE